MLDRRGLGKKKSNMASEQSRFNIDANALENYGRRVNLDVDMRFAVLVSAHVEVRRACS